MSWISVEVPPRWIISYLLSPQRTSVIFIMRMLTPALGLNPGYLLLVLVNQPRAPWNSSAGSLNAVSRVVSKSLLTDSGRLQQCHAGAGTWGQGPGNALPFFFVLLCWRFEAEVQLWIQPGWQRMRGWCWKWQLVCALCSSRWTRGPMAAPSEQWQIKPHSSLKASNHNTAAVAPVWPAFVWVEYRDLCDGPLFTDVL